METTTEPLPPLQNVNVLLGSLKSSKQVSEWVVEVVTHSLFLLIFSLILSCSFSAYYNRERERENRQGSKNEREKVPNTPGDLGVWRVWEGARYYGYNTTIKYKHTPIYTY